MKELNEKLFEYYNAIDNYVYEIHDDGKLFVQPFNYCDFVSVFEINDAEQGFDAYVATDGMLVVDIKIFENRVEDYDLFKQVVLSKALN